MKDHKLTPSMRQETKGLVVNALKNALTGTGKNLGVSRGWLIRQVELLDLNQEEVEELIQIRTEHQGLLPHAVKLLRKGMTVTEVLGCYRVQRELIQFGGKEHHSSITKIARLVQTFAEADPDDEDLAESISRAHHFVARRYFWIHYVDQTISVLCSIARHHDCATIEAAMAMIEGRQGKRDGVLSDEEDDEVEKQRADYEDRNNIGNPHYRKG